MDDFISINEALDKLKGFTKFDIFNAAITGRIRIYWWPSGDGVELVEMEISVFIGLDDIEKEGYAPIKGMNIVRNQYGSFFLDTKIDNRYRFIFETFKNSKGIHYVIDLHDEPFLIRDLQGAVFGLHVDESNYFTLRAVDDLVININEIISIKKTLKNIRDGSTTTKDKITYIRIKLIRNYVEKNNFWNRVIEPSKQGKSGFRSVLLKCLFETKIDSTGGYLFSIEGKSLSKKGLNKDTFYEAYNQVKSKYLSQLRAINETLT